MPGSGTDNGSVHTKSTTTLLDTLIEATAKGDIYWGSEYSKRLLQEYHGTGPTISSGETAPGTVQVTPEKAITIDEPALEAFLADMKKDTEQHYFTQVETDAKLVRNAFKSFHELRSLPVPDPMYNAEHLFNIAASGLRFKFEQEVKELKQASAYNLKADIALEKLADCLISGSEGLRYDTVLLDKNGIVREQWQREYAKAQSEITPSESEVGAQEDTLAIARKMIENERPGYPRFANAVLNQFYKDKISALGKEVVIAPEVDDYAFTGIGEGYVPADFVEMHRHDALIHADGAEVQGRIDPDGLGQAV